jgi:hypothetical protein
VVTANLTDGEKNVWEIYLVLNEYASDSLGPKQWRLVQGFGKIMDGGQNSGLYISSLSAEEARAIVDDLMDGRIVKVHLMHRHVSGIYEASSLCRRAGRLIMMFDDRSEFA